MTLQATQLQFAYPESPPVIRNISLELAAGEIVGILGPNGSGKTTLLSLLAGLLAPKSGTILLKSQDLATMSIRERAFQLSFVPQTDTITLPFSVEEIVAMGRQPHHGFFGFEKMADQAAVTQALEQTNCTELRTRSLQSLSGGERRRVILARALAQATPLILLDEPTAHLDIHYQIEVCDLLSQLREQAQRGILITLHDINLAALYCDRILLLQEGEVRAAGNPNEVITADHLHAVFGVEVIVEIDPQTNRPFCRLQKKV